MKILRIIRFITKHPLNRHAPLQAVLRFLFWQVRSRTRKAITFDWIGGTKLIVKNGMTGATGNIYCGLHEYTDMSFILHTLREGDLFIDVGSNIGSYTILASGICGADTIAIEPDPETASHLRKNIKVNELANHVQIVEAAVGAENGTINFTIGRDTTNQVANGTSAPTRIVPLAPLDQIIGDKTPTVIKMDVEGYETETLKGALRTLARPTLLAIEIETADDEGIAILKKHGFQRAAYDPATRELSTSKLSESSNALFVRNLPALRERLKQAPQRKWRGITV